MKDKEGKAENYYGQKIINSAYLWRVSVLENCSLRPEPSAIQCSVEKQIFTDVSEDIFTSIFITH